MGAWGGGIGNKAQLRPAKAGAGAWPELGKNDFYPNSCSEKNPYKKKDIFLLMPNNVIRLVKKQKFLI